MLLHLLSVIPFPERIRLFGFFFLHWKEIPVHCNTYLQSGTVSPVSVEHDSVQLVGLQAKVHVPGADL